MWSDLLWSFKFRSISIPSHASRRRRKHWLRKDHVDHVVGQALPLHPHFEEVDNNPYLNDFYKDMTRWSFNLQVYFLRSRFSQLIEMKKKGKPIIQDRTIYEDANIFAPNLQAMGLMTTRDFGNYLSLFELMEEFVTPPDLLVYLRASVPTLVSQIQKRGRDYEEAIRLDYLNRLNERYEAWISTYTKGELLIVDVDDSNFHENKEDLGKIITSIDGKLNNLFS